MAARRILLKMSGQSLCPAGEFGLNPATVLSIAREIVERLQGADIQLACVVGGGNFVRGETIAGQEIERVTGFELPEGEYDQGLSHGDSYPVFDTDFGRMASEIGHGRVQKAILPPPQPTGVVE